MKQALRFALHALALVTFVSSASAQEACGTEWVRASVSSQGSVAICYDEARAEVITQSGGKLWAWNGSAWVERWSEPLLDGIDAIAYDRNRRVCYLFGGANYDDRLWIWNGQTLTLVANDTIGGRAYCAMAFDWKRDRLVIHGGQAASQQLYSSWHEWNPASGAWASWANGPIDRRYAHKMVYDPVREVCVLHGGYYFGNRNDTWAWNGTVWSLVTTSGPARYVANMAWDPEHQQVVLHGGTTCCGEVEYPSTWTWAGGAWTQCTLQGPARGYTNMAYDAGRHCFVLPGGIGPTANGRQWIPETWVLRMPIVLPPCAGDFNRDGVIDGRDLAAVLGAWGTANPQVDLNQDGIVNGADLTPVLGHWGECTP